MAISQIMSNPSDWLSQPNYQSDFSIVTTQTAETFPVTVASSGATAAASRNNNNNNNSLSPDQGRISKPLRRRPRASRRTPTTLLSTDTTNFRAMVQHFTGGGPSSSVVAAPFAARPSGGAALNFTASQHMMGTATNAGGFRMQYPAAGHQQQHMAFMVNHNVHGHGGSGGETAAVRGSSSASHENQNYGNYML